MIHVVVGILFNTAGQVFIAKRPPHKPYPGYWEFPGGKVEENEPVFAALVRELQEEIGIQVISATSWLQFQHQYPERNVFLDVWKINQFTGDPSGKEGQAVQWIAPAQFEQFQFPAGNKIILEKLHQSVFK